MAVPQKGLRNAAAFLARRRLLLPALLAAIAATLLSAVVVYRAALADALLAQLQATAAQPSAACATDQVHAALRNTAACLTRAERFTGHRRFGGHRACTVQHRTAAASGSPPTSDALTRIYCRRPRSERNAAVCGALQ